LQKVTLCCEVKRVNFKDTEIRVLAELMKNSRKSDREIARVVGVSQPTITRLRTKLEKSGVIKEYTLIPDFKQLGYQIMAVVFMGKQETTDKKYRQELRKAAVELEDKTPQACLTVVDGMGLDKGRMLIFLYKDYGDYTRGLETIRSLTHVEADELETFLVDLTDESLFRILSLKQIARHFQTYGKKPERPL
jgi:DNA-binding Lrp family transcriptional regulator